MKIYTDALGRPDPALTQHELVRTTEAAINVLRRLAGQLRMCNDPTTHEDAAPKLDELRRKVDAMQWELTTAANRIHEQRRKALMEQYHDRLR